MTFMHLFTLLLKRWWLILLSCLLVGTGAYLGSKLITPVYQATTLLQLTIRSSTNQADYNSLLASDELLQTEAQLAISEPVLHEVALHHPGLSNDQLTKMVSSSTKTSTQLFVISIQDSSPQRASDLANEVAATFIQQQTQAAALQAGQAQQQIQQDLDATQLKSSTLTTQIVTLQAAGNNQLQVALLQSQLTALQQHAAQLENVLAQLKLAQAQQGDFLHVVQAAQPPPRPTQPNVFLNTVIGLATGLLLGIVLAVLLEQLDTRIRKAESLSQLLGYSQLATIWQAHSEKQADVFSPQGSDNNVESYRILRTNIGFASIEQPLHSLLVTSALPQEGKSTIASNLAIFLARAGKTTLLIDADLRRPKLHTLFDLAASSQGLSNAILMYATTNPSVRSRSQLLKTTPTPQSEPEIEPRSLEQFFYPTAVPNLWLMPAGTLPPNPPELLASRAMKAVIQALQESDVEMLIFDAPPLLGLSDARILAPQVDSSLLVVDIRKARRDQQKQAQHLLKQAGSHVAGFVVNRQLLRHRDRVSGYYYNPAQEQPQLTTDDAPLTSLPNTLHIDTINESATEDDCPTQTLKRYPRNRGTTQQLTRTDIDDEK